VPHWFSSGLLSSVCSSRSRGHKGLRRWKVVEHDVDGGVRMVSDDIVDLLLCVTVQLDMDADPDATAG
jgi:hypothetical protein